MMKEQQDIENGYSAGHPWYYRLGGAVLYPKQIREEARSRGYRGCSEARIEAADQKAEPNRSEALRKLQARAKDDLVSDLGMYRKGALKLYRVRQGLESDSESICDNVHMMMALKHNHIYNDFAHLLYIDELLSQQPDLFDF